MMKQLNSKTGLKFGKKKGSKWLSILKKQAVEFCLETGLHGYKYIVQSQRSKPERIIWAIAVFASLCCAIILMKLTWDHYVTYPTLTVIESTHHGIWNYPFPAVTICDINRVSLNLSRQLVEKLKIPPNMTKEFVAQEMRLLIALLDPVIFEKDVSQNLTQLQDIIDSNGLTISEVVRSVTRGCEDLIGACKWRSLVVNCSELIRFRLSRNGWCCSFNYITSEEIRTKTNMIPRRVPACGYQTGITFMLKFAPNDNHASILGAFGAKIMVHHPYDYPDDNAAYKLIPMGNQAFLTIEPETTYSIDTVRSLAISMRDCIFEDESSIIPRKLKKDFTFVKYSYLNCLAECRAITIKKKCGCIPYYFPQNGTKVCNLKDIGCLKKYRFWYDTSWPGEETTSEILSKGTLDPTRKPCGCIPDCNFYRYFIESSQGKLDNLISHINFNYKKISGDNKSAQNYSVLHVFFGDLMSKQYRRHVSYNWRNLFASFGGLLGLFAGFSLVSLFEFVYFFVIRVIVDMCMKKEE